MTFELRDYQADVIDRVRSRMEAGVKRVLVQGPTGSGKTVQTAYMIGTAALRGYQSWFVVHRRELIKQSCETFREVGIPHGIIAADFRDDPSKRVHVCSVQTLSRRYMRLKRPEFIIWDEAHHVAAASWARIHAGYPVAFHVGLTATPERLDGAGLHQWFNEIVAGPSVRELIRDGWLSPYRLFAPSTVSVKGVRTKMGDFLRSDLADAVNRPSITGDVLAHYLRLAEGKRALIFCVSVQHSKEVVRQFLGAGIPAEHVDGETPTAQRDGAMRRFRNGETLALSNCDLFGEGVDVPALEVAILLRPTQSLALYLQQVGRALRPSPGKKEALILDHAGNCQRHGLPDEHRDWSLGQKPRRKRETESEVPVRICPACFAAQRPGPPACPYCGHVFQVKPREVERVEGELVEIDPAERRDIRAREMHSCTTIPALIALGKRLGYKNPYMWARHVQRARRRKEVRQA